jgi:Spy/CpxP family protein refolding chaperone
MFKKPKALAATALLALFAIPFAAEAAARRPSPEEILRNPRLLARYLRLTEDQIDQAEALRQTLQGTLEPLREAGKGLREAYRDALEATPQDACAIGQAAIDVYDNGEKIKDALEDFDEAFSALLTPEQLRRYEALKEAARLLRGGPGEEG